MLHDITSMTTHISHSHHHQNPVTGHEGVEKEQGYSSTFSFTFVLDGSGWSKYLIPVRIRSPTCHMGWKDDINW